MTTINAQFCRNVKPQDREQIFRDRHLILRVGKQTKTFSYRSERKGKRVSKVLGHWPKMTAQEAHEAALVEHAANVAGKFVNTGKRNQPRIRNVWPLFETDRRDRGLSEKTFEDFDFSMRRLSDHILDAPLRDLNRFGMRAEIRRIRKKHGPFAGNNTVRFVKNLWNFAFKLFEGTEAALPFLNPCEGIAIIKPEDQPVIEPAAFAAWFAEVEAIDNDLHKAAWKLALLSGLRKNDLLTLQWSNLDRKARTIRIPRPKGRRPFDLVLSRAMIRELVAARRAALAQGLDGKFVFPSGVSGRGHVRLLRPISTGLHTLRRSYSNAAIIAGVAVSNVGVLLNQAPPTITLQRYVHVPVILPQLRRDQEAISQYIQGHTVKLTHD
jgi:integrase